MRAHQANAFAIEALRRRQPRQQARDELQDDRGVDTRDVAIAVHVGGLLDAVLRARPARRREADRSEHDQQCRGEEEPPCAMSSRRTG